MLKLALSFLALTSFANAEWKYRVSRSYFGAKNALVMSAKVTTSSTADAYKKIFKELVQYAKDNRIVVGHAFSIIHEYNTKEISFSAGFFTTRKLKDHGDIKSILVKGTKVISTVHKGPYTKLADAYKALEEFAKAKKVQVNGAPLEIYLNSPDKVKPDSLLTQVMFPIK